MFVLRNPCPYSASMSTSPGPLLQALDALWEHLRTQQAELPAARIAITPTPPPAKHNPERWTRDGEVVTGLVVSADTLKEGADAVLEHVLHEAAHVLSWVRGDQDTTTRGTYHTGTYLAAAEEVGLRWPPDAPRDPHRGYVSPRLTPETLTTYTADVRALEQAIPLVLPHLVIPDAQTAYRPRNRLYLQCGCDDPRRIQMSPRVAARGPVICGVCEQAFKEA